MVLNIILNFINNKNFYKKVNHRHVKSDENGCIQRDMVVGDEAMLLFFI